MSEPMACPHCSEPATTEAQHACPAVTAFCDACGMKLTSWREYHPVKGCKLYRRTRWPWLVRELLKLPPVHEWPRWWWLGWGLILYAIASSVVIGWWAVPVALGGAVVAIPNDPRRET